MLLSYSCSHPLLRAGVYNPSGAACSLTATPNFQLQTCSPPPALPASPRPAAPPCATPPPRRTRGSPRPGPTRTSARATPRTRTRATTSTVSTQLGALTAAKFLIPALIVGGGVVYYTSMAGAKESVKGSPEGLTKEQTALKTASVSFRWEELTAGPGGQVRRGDADRRAEEGGEGVSRCLLRGAPALPRTSEVELFDASLSRPRASAVCGTGIPGANRVPWVRVGGGDRQGHTISPMQESEGRQSEERWGV